MQGLIDAHFHLDMYTDYEEMYNWASQKQQYTLCMTNSPGVFLSCKKIFKYSKYVKFALGFHPLNVDLTKKDLGDFMYLLPQTNYVGEIGLDFTKRAGLHREWQLECFDKIVEACAQGNKLMSVHIRKAEKEAIETIKKYFPNRCILHWYTGSVETQKEFIDVGCYFSVNANMLSNVQIVKNIPKNRILIESDGPYSKVEGVKFRPQMLLKEYELIAKALNEPNLIEIVYTNFKTLLTK